MTIALINKQKSLSVACTLALAMLSGLAGAQTPPSETGYVTDQRGVAVRSAYNLCWHNGTGPAPASPNECDLTAPAHPIPAPVAKAPEAAAKPMVVAAAPQPAAGKVTLDADALFDFNKAVLRPEGRKALDEFFTKMAGISPEVIIAVGHADRFGTEAYNQGLSERRADAVKAYLLDKGVDANRVKTEGKGKTQPMTKAGECTGAKSAKVIACLQPDRRVDIEVVGTQIAR